MINLNKDCLSYLNSSQDLVDIIHIISLFTKAEGVEINCIFKQYYKNLNLPKYVSQIKQENHHYVIYTNIFSFIGIYGVLPSHYTDRIVKSIKIKDFTLLRFLDIFYNEVMRLLIDIVNHFNLTSCLKHYAFSKNKYVPKTISLIGSIGGVVSKEMTNELMPLICNSGMLHMFSKPKAMLEDLLYAVFAVPVRIKEFVLSKVSFYKLLDFVVPLGKKESTIEDVFIGDAIYPYQDNIEIVFFDVEIDKHYFFLKMLNQKKLLTKVLKSYLQDNISYSIKVIFANASKVSYLGCHRSATLGATTFLSN